MADLDVEVEDDDVVEVALEDDSHVVEPKGKANDVVVKAKEQEPKTSDEATTALTQAVKNAEEARRAAEATAVAERRRAEEAMRHAAQREAEATGYRERAETSELAMIENAIAAASTEVSAAAADWARHMEAGEFVKAGEAQSRQTKAATNLAMNEARKADYESRRPRMADAGGAVEARPANQESPFERYLGQFDPVAQGWLRQHPECAVVEAGGNREKNAQMMRGHYEAMAKGQTPNSREYFQTIEDSIADKPKAKVEEAVVEPAKPAPKQRQAQPSAPPTREPLGSPAPGSRSVRLTKDQQAAAKISFPHLEPMQAYGLYAKNLLELEAEGKMGRTTH